MNEQSHAYLLQQKKDPTRLFLEISLLTHIPLFNPPKNRFFPWKVNFGFYEARFLKRSQLQDTTLPISLLLLLFSNALDTTLPISFLFYHKFLFL
jgi:hypothetical protein